MLKSILLFTTTLTSVLACPLDPSPTPRPGSRCNVPTNLTAIAPPADDLSLRLEKRRLHFDCKGSIVCGWPWSDACDEAYAKIKDDTVYTTGHHARLTGECATKPKWPTHKNGCGIFISKLHEMRDRSEGGTQRDNNCQVSGITMKHHYDEIRRFGCKRCGHATSSVDGCRVVIGYVANCDS